MLNKLLFLFFAAITYQSCSLCSDIAPNELTVKWYTNYEEAKRLSKSTAKPLVLFFTGSDWCCWCTKLEDETFDTPELAQQAANKFIFVKLDFPLYTAQDPSPKDQNKQLQHKFDVRCFPTIVVLEPQQHQQIGTFGYRPGGGKMCADHLNKIVTEFAAYKHNVSALETKKFSGKELKHLYEKSKELALINDTNNIVKHGINSDESLYFLVQRYRSLADEGQIHGKEAVAVRQKLLMADPNNEHLTQYQVALIEFEAYSEESYREHYSAEQTTSPLVAYINKFGDKDKDHLWRLKIIISQVYLDKNQMSNALKYAQESYDTAPSCAQAEIGRAIKNIRSQIHSKHLPKTPECPKNKII